MTEEMIEAFTKGWRRPSVCRVGGRHHLVTTSGHRTGSHKDCWLPLGQFNVLQDGRRPNAETAMTILREDDDDRGEASSARFSWS